MTPSATDKSGHHPLLSVIILNWNGLELLKQFLPTAIRFTNGPEVELIVADNGSTDDSVRWIRETYPDLRVMEFGENLGFAAGYNRALREAGTEFSILLNSDVEVTQDWWKPLLDFLQDNPEAGACQPKILSFRERSKFEYAGAAGGLIDNLGYPYCRGRLMDIVEEDKGQYDDGPERIAWASGAALAVRVSVYFEAGGLDEDFFAHMEEIDLCCRMQGLGYSVWVVPSSSVFHVGGATLEQGNPKKTYLNFRNNLLLIYKNTPESKVGKRLFIRRLVDSLAWGMYMIKGDFKNARAILKAHGDYRKMKGKYKVHPERDYLKNLPGADRSVLIARYLPFLDRKKRNLR